MSLQPSLQWSKAGSPLEGCTQPSLKLPTFDESAAGTYSCRLENELGDAVTVPIELSILEEQPAFVLLPSAARVDVGQPASFEVEVTGYPLPQYSWTKDGGVIEDATGPLLEIPSVTHEHPGEYECTATNPLGSCKSGPVPLELTGEAPVFVTQPTDTAGLLDHTVAVTCSVMGIPFPKLQWYFKGTAVPHQTSTEVRELLA